MLARLANVVLIGVTSICVLVLIGTVAGGGPDRASVGVVLPLLGLAMLLPVLRLSPVIRVNVALLIVLGTVALYAAELALMPKRNTIRRVAEESGRSYDGRSKAQVVSDLRRAGTEAYPAVHRGAATVEVGGREIAVLGGISGVTSVMCNERGEYASYVSDEHGFNNPPGLWTGAPLDMAVVGDSYTMGWCVPPEENLVALLRGRYPRTLNLGVGGNGPLTELATLKEYLPRLRPPVVVWAYFENDLRDLEEEKRNPRLMRYLADSLAGLIDLQGEIDRQLRAEMDSALRAIPAGAAARSRGAVIREKLERFARLHHVRAVVAASFGIARPASGEAGQCCDLDLFARVLADARATVDGWGGTLYFVFIPSRERYDLAPPVQISEEELGSRDAVLAIADSLGLPVIDVDRAFRRNRRPETLYVYPGAHFDLDGYRTAASALLDGLAAGMSGNGEARSASRSSYRSADDPSN